MEILDASEYRKMVKDMVKDKTKFEEFDKIALDFIEVLGTMSDILETLNRDVINERNKYILMREKLKGVKDGH